MATSNQNIAGGLFGFAITAGITYYRIKERKK